jgi:hypothetical protein
LAFGFYRLIEVSLVIGGLALALAIREAAEIEQPPRK